MATMALKTGASIGLDKSLCTKVTSANANDGIVYQLNMALLLPLLFRPHDQD